MTHTFSKYRILLPLLLLLSAPLCGQVSQEILKEAFSEGITVDLRDPTYSDGVLTTETGGVIAGPNLRIQAMKIQYTRKKVDDTEILTIEAEDNLMLEYGEYILIGKRLEYDLTAREGTLYEGKSGLDPWYFGGEKIELKADNSIVIHEGFITTSPNVNADWQLQTSQATISADHLLHAKNVKFHFYKLPVFWLPTFKTNLDWILDSPIRYRIRWGGTQGVRLGMIYEVISWDTLSAFLRFDYRFNRGPGGGIETEYESLDHREKCHTISYVARDSSTEDPSERTRYRLEGVYSYETEGKTFTVDLSYDKLSDKEMATDYYDKNLDLKTAGRTQLNIHRQIDEIAVTNLFTRVRVNGFQSLKQELPTVSGSLHPFVLGSSGIISENTVSAGYLDYAFTEDQGQIPDFRSSRLECRQRVYRPVEAGPLIITPEAKLVGILYGSSPQHDAKWLGVASCGGEVKTQLYRTYANAQHIIEPYLSYQYIAPPTISPGSHYIFDIDDGWARLSALRFGARNLIYTYCPLIRSLSVDTYGYAFFKTPTMEKTIPKLYTNVLWDMTPSLRHSIGTAWDIERYIVDHFNVRSTWTLNADFAISAEYRHRSAFSWRKDQPDNFILESFRSEQVLRHTSLSDRRNTLLYHVFYRFLPTWAVECEVRHGWRRLTEPGYLEYQTDLLSNLHSAWEFRLSYQKREDDHRVALYVTLGPRKPK